MNLHFRNSLDYRISCLALILASTLFSCSEKRIRFDFGEGNYYLGKEYNLDSLESAGWSMVTSAPDCDDTICFTLDEIRKKGASQHTIGLEFYKQNLIGAYVIWEKSDSCSWHISVEKDVTFDCQTLILDSVFTLASNKKLRVQKRKRDFQMHKYD